MTSVYSQSQTEQPKSKDAEEKVKQVKEDLEKVADSAAETALNKLRKPNLDPRFLRVKEFQARHAAFRKAHADGKARPFPDLVANWSLFEKKLESAKTLSALWKSEKSETRKERLSSELFELLQLIGPYLRSATHSGSVATTLFTQQVSELKRLAALELELAKVDPKKAAVRLLSSSNPYTVTFLPVPISFSAPAGTKIILSAETSGQFANGLAKIEITADDQNRASTYWLSTGDAVSASTLIYRSSELTGVGEIVPMVQRLELIPLNVISNIANTNVPKNIPTKPESNLEKKLKTNSKTNP